MIALLAVFLLQSLDSLPPKPAAPPAGWQKLIGAYAHDRDTLYVYEDQGTLFARVDSVPMPLDARAGSVFRDGDLQLRQARWSRLQLGPADGGQLRIAPVRPVAELLREDRSLVPPA